MKLPPLCSYRTGIQSLVLMALVGCASLSPQERDAKRAELDAMSEKAMATLLQSKPEAADSLDKSVGYAVVHMTTTKIPMVGAGSGAGVVVDKRSSAHSYVKVSRFEVGGGLGAQKFKVIIFFFDEKLLAATASGAWHFDAGAEAAAGSASAEGTASGLGDGYKAYRLAEEGAVATVTVRVAYATPYLQ